MSKSKIAVWMERNTMRLIFGLVVLVWLSLAFTPANAAEFTLEIFGNANMDGTIDEYDVEYVQGIIDGTNDPTEFADANYNGEIDEDDIVRIKQIINGEESELTLIDTGDRVVTIEIPVKRIIAGHQFGVLKSLGLDLSEIAVGRYNQLDLEVFPELSSDLLDVGSGWSPDIEKILSLEPDVVMLHPTGGPFDTEPTLSTLEASGVAVLCIKCQTPEIHREEVTKLGYIFNRREEAESYLDWYENLLSSVEEIVDDIPEEERVKVYFEGYKPYTTYPAYSYIEESGGIDIFAGATGGEIDAEAVVDQNPDVILKVAYPGGGYHLEADNNTELKLLRDEIMDRPELQEVKAVKDGRVHVITSYLLTYMPHCSNLECFQVAYQAKWFYPELFEDLDPKAVHQEYLTRFQRWDYDQNDKGVFVYPSSD
jgi:iron complex transport system substrate-binding protein